MSDVAVLKSWRIGLSQLRPHLTNSVFPVVYPPFCPSTRQSQQTAYPHISAFHLELSIKCQTPPELVCMKHSNGVTAASLLTHHVRSATASSASALTSTASTTAIRSKPRLVCRFYKTKHGRPSCSSSPCLHFQYRNSSTFNIVPI